MRKIFRDTQTGVHEIFFVGRKLLSPNMHEDATLRSSNHIIVSVLGPSLPTHLNFLIRSTPVEVTREYLIL